jgi:hypothetical protein
VGHVEQLRRSACYQKSDDLTCVTCHDPHRRTVPPDPTAYYREKCLSCHTRRPCSLDEAARRKKEPSDSCAACHMPRGDTEIPHIAFTHHRIGRHESQPSAPPVTRIPDLVPIEEPPGLTPLDRQRNLGLAYADVARSHTYAQYADVFRARARQLLEDVQAAGLREGETAVALAEIYWKTDPVRASVYARQALEAKDTPARDRASALLLLADCEWQDHNYQSAIDLLEEAVRLRRSAEDWRLLGLSYLGQNQPQKAQAALQQALAIRPFRPTTHLGLAELYRRTGDVPHSNEHYVTAQWLLRHRQD